jgi:anti-sigma regulatory factor (Ser/Thr protein kinase)
MPASGPGGHLTWSNESGDPLEILNCAAESSLTEASPAETVDAASRPGPRSCRVACGTGVDAPATARQVARAVFRRWAVPEDLIGRALLIVSEFVANAVRHARTRSELMLQLQGRHLRIAVRDTCRRLPQVTGAPDVYREDGRGLGIVGRLATSWGVVADPGGKVVWADLCLSP